MPTSNFEITPVLPPTLTTAPAQYEAYLASYQLYVDKIQKIRSDVAKERAVKRKPTPVPKPRPPPPSLKQETREAIGKAFSEGVKFGSLKFSKEELSAARKRWQTLSERRSARKDRPLNGRERQQLTKAKIALNRVNNADRTVQLWDEVVQPAMASFEKRMAQLNLKISEAVGDDKKGQLQRIPPGTAFNNFAASSAFVDSFVLGLDNTVKYLDLIKKGEPTNLEREVLKSKIELIKSETDVKKAQAQAQRTRSQLKRTVTTSVRGHVTEKDREGATVIMVPETSTQVESLLESGTAASVQTEQIAAPSRVESFTVRGGRITAATHYVPPAVQPSRARQDWD